MHLVEYINDVKYIEIRMNNQLGKQIFFKLLSQTILTCKSFIPNMNRPK